MARIYGPYSNEATATPSAMTVLNLVATAGDGEVALTWTAVAGASGYEVYWDTTTGAPYASQQDAATNGAVVGGLTNGTPYYFSVRAYKTY